MLDKENFHKLLLDFSKVFRPTTFEHNLIEKVFLDFIKTKVKENTDLYIHRQSDTLICYQGHPKVAFIAHGDLPLVLEGVKGKVSSDNSLTQLQDSKGNKIKCENGIVSKPRFELFPYQGNQDFSFSKSKTEISGYHIGSLTHLLLILELVSQVPNFAFAITQGFFQSSRGTNIAAQFLENIPSVQVLFCLEVMENNFYSKGPSLGVKTRPQEKVIHQVNPGNVWNMDQTYDSVHGARLDQFGVFKDWVCGGLSSKNKGSDSESVSWSDIEKLFHLMKDLSQWKSL